MNVTRGRYNVSVIGYSGPISTNQNSQIDSSSELDGVGKSSFCARFMYPHQVKILKICSIFMPCNGDQFGV